MIDLAEEKFNQIISQNPEVEIPSIYQLAFQIEKSKRNTKAAINTLQKAITTFPDHESLKDKISP
jgi:TolA-binding protein